MDITDNKTYPYNFPCSWMESNSEALKHPWSRFLALNGKLNKNSEMSRNRTKVK